MGSFPPPAAQVILRFVCLGILTKRHQFQPLIGFVKTSAQGPELKSVLPTCRLHRERSWAFWIFTCKKKKKKITLYINLYIYQIGGENQAFEPVSVHLLSLELYCVTVTLNTDLSSPQCLYQKCWSTKTVFLLFYYSIYLFSSTCSFKAIFQTFPSGQGRPCVNFLHSCLVLPLYFGNVPFTHTPGSKEHRSTSISKLMDAHTRPGVNSFVLISQKTFFGCFHWMLLLKYLL